MREESIAATGFYGQFWAPPVAARAGRPCWNSAALRAGVFATGKLIGAALAAAGYPTLDIAYFGEPGLPGR